MWIIEKESKIVKVDKTTKIWKLRKYEKKIPKVSQKPYPWPFAPTDLAEVERDWIRKWIKSGKWRSSSQSHIARDRKRCVVFMNGLELPFPRFQRPEKFSRLQVFVYHVSQSKCSCPCLWKIMPKEKNSSPQGHPWNPTSSAEYISKVR